MSGKVKMVLSTLLFAIIVAALGFWLFFGPILIVQHTDGARDEIIGRIEQLEDKMDGVDKQDS